MAEHISGSLLPDARFPLSELPATALQALYHAVTGRTETYSKRLTKNVIIKREDLDRLCSMLRQQMQHYTISAGPTITIKHVFANQRTEQYSSWERFSIQDASTLDITSEILIKVEFLLHLPETRNPQRCIINLTIDSKLPVYTDIEEEDFDFPIWFMSNSPRLTFL